MTSAHHINNASKTGKCFCFPLAASLSSQQPHAPVEPKVLHT